MLMKIVVVGWIIGVVVSWAILGAYTYSIEKKYCGRSKEQFLEELRNHVNLKEAIKGLLYLICWPILFSVGIYYLKTRELFLKSMKTFNDSFE